MNIIDMHSHILPGADDGAADLAEALSMLSMAEKEGITHIICTPHYGSIHETLRREKLQKVFEEFQKASKEHGSPIELYLGNEVYYFHEMIQALEDGEVLPLNESAHVLIEFHPKDTYQNIRNGLYQVNSSGFKAVLAHAERYECLLKNLSYAEELHRMGIKLQVNASSVTAGFGSGIRHYVHSLLKRRLVDYISTDAHSSHIRAPKIQKCKEILQRKYDMEYVRALLYENALQDFILNKQSKEE